MRDLVKAEGATVKKKENSFFFKSMKEAFNKLGIYFSRNQIINSYFWKAVK